MHNGHLRSILRASVAWGMVIVFHVLATSCQAALVTYVYDDLNRLTRADYGSGDYTQYSYDEVGNRTALTSFQTGRLLSADSAKKAADNRAVSFSGSIVTASFPGYFYIETDDRSSGIRVVRENHGMSAGIRAYVTGATRTNDAAERFIDADYVIQAGTGSVDPIGMSNLAVGGGDWQFTPGNTGGQKGVAEGRGLNNIGLLVRVWGQVSYRAGDRFYLDDGSGINDGNQLGAGGSAVPGLWVALPAGSFAPDVGTFVTVTGISSCEKLNYAQVRVLRVWRTSDIQLATGAAISGRVTQPSTVVAQVVECAHPYPNNYNNTWTITGPTGTTSVRMHFTQIALESGYDYLRVQNGSGTTQQTYGSNYTNVWSNWVTGNTIKLNLTSDSSVVYYGFQMDKYEALVPNTPTAGVTLTLTPGSLTTTTAVDGTFSFSGLTGGTYTLTPSLGGATFTPPNRSVTISNGQYAPGNDFVRN